MEQGNLLGQSIVAAVKEAVAPLAALDEQDQIDAINEIKRVLHGVSPMKSEPVDCVLWVDADSVTANDYNPNSVAPPEMRLLELSIMADGYTQPIVAFLREDAMEVVDGFHRNRVGKECKSVRERVKGRLPVVAINDDRREKGDRIAATIRHNRARGKHSIDGMSEIVVELKRRNWSDKKIGKNLGMEPDEVLRLCQITGLAEMFKDKDFSLAWEAADVESITDLDRLDVEGEGETE